jgi:hypothetical protein
VLRSMPATLGLSDFLTYVFVAALLLVAGTGLLLLLRAPFDRVTMVLLGPIATQALWAITVGLGLLCGLSVRRLGPPLLLGTVLLACIGLRHLLRRRNLRSSRPPLAAILVSCAVAPVIVLLPHFVFGLADYPGSRMGDGWWYVVTARHLWTFGYWPGATVVLEPLYRYTTYQVAARDVAAASLGVLSLLDHAGDTQRPVGLLMALALFTFGTSAAAVAVSRSWQTGRSILFIVLVVVSGWAANAVYATNYDNLLALGYFPAIAALVRVLQSRSRGSWIVLGVIAAGLAYTYPELGVPILAVGLVMVAERSWKARSWRDDVRGLGLAAVVFLLLAGPHLQWTIRHFSRQTGLVFQSSQASARPGGTLFSGLLIPKYQASAFWSLGGERLVPTYHAARMALGFLLFILLATGIAHLLRSRDLGILAALTLPLVAGPVLIFGSAYGYGAYKVILIGWWAVVLCLVEATASFWRPGIYWRALTALSVAVCFTIPTVAFRRSVALVVNARDSTKVQEVFDTVSAALRSMEQFRPLEEVQRIVGQEPVGIFVQDWESLEWAPYFLRDAHTRLGVFAGYLAMPGVRPPLESSPYPWEGMRYILSDAEDPGPVVEAQSWTLVWRAGPYRLWDTSGSSWAIVTDVDNPYGVERVDEKPFMWLGGGTTRLQVTAQYGTCLVVTGTMFPGPSVSRPNERTLLVRSAIGPSSTITMSAGTNRFVVPLPPGASEIDLTPQDRPDKPAGNSDPRSLIAGLADLRSSLVEAPVRLIGIDNPNGMEQYLGRPFFWMGNGSTRIRLRASRLGDVNLVADFTPGPSIAATVPSRRLRLSGPGFKNPIDIAISGGPMTTRIPVEQGDSVVSMDALDSPTIPRQPNGDRRPLILGVSGLHVESDTCPR